MIIISSRPGQLGNSLYLFAHFIAYSLETNSRLVNVAFCDYAEYFPSVSGDCMQRFPPRKTLLRQQWLRNFLYHICFYTGRVLHRLQLDNRFITCIYLDWDQNLFLDDDSNRMKFSPKIVFVQGWGFRCAPYFMKHADFIRNFFLPDPECLQRVEGALSTVKKNGDMLIGVHIRHGDYARFEGGRFFYQLEEYLNLMNQAVNIFHDRKISFLVCSNAKLDYSVFEQLNICFSTGHELDDMIALSECDYIMGPPSTYSMWSSFYGKVPLYMIKDKTHPLSRVDFELPEVWMREKRTQ